MTDDFASEEGSGVTNAPGRDIGAHRSVFGTGSSTSLFLGAGLQHAFLPCSHTPLPSTCLLPCPTLSRAIRPDREDASAQTRPSPTHPAPACQIHGAVRIARSHNIPTPVARNPTPAHPHSRTHTPTYPHTRRAAPSPPPTNTTPPLSASRPAAAPRRASRCRSGSRRPPAGSASRPVASWWQVGGGDYVGFRCREGLMLGLCEHAGDGT